MNGPEKGVDARSASARTSIRLRQEIRATSEDVQRMISQHYAARNVQVSPSQIVIEVSSGGGSGMSYSAAAFRGATIRFFGEAAKAAEADGLPTTLRLTPEAVAAIVARRFGEGLGRNIGPASIDWEVSGGGGSSYSQSGPSLRSALLRLEMVI